MTTIQLRRGTAAQWTASARVLASGEVGVEIDTDRFKIGDGVTAWAGLDYFSTQAAAQASAVAASVAQVNEDLQDPETPLSQTLQESYGYLSLVGSQASADLFPAFKLRGSTIDSFVARPLGSSPTRHPLEWIHDDTAGYLMHLTFGPNAGGSACLIGGGGDHGAGTVFFANNKDAGVGFKGTNNNTITSPLAFALQINSGSSIAPGAWFGSGRTDSKPATVIVQNVLGASGARLAEWRASSYRTDAGCGTTSGSPTITDAAIGAGDQGKIVTGPGVPSQTYVGTVTAGVSFKLSSSATSQVDVNATATATVSLNVATGNGDVLAGYVGSTDANLVWQTYVSVQPDKISRTPLTIAGLAGQTADLLSVNPNGAAGAFKVTSAGEAYAAGRMGVRGAAAQFLLENTSGTSNQRMYQLRENAGAFEVRSVDNNNASARMLLSLAHQSGNLTLRDAAVIATDAQVTGLKLGAAATQKLGFYGVAPAVQPLVVADATDAATAITQLNALLSRLRTIGLVAA